VFDMFDMGPSTRKSSAEVTKSESNIDKVQYASLLKSGSKGAGDLSSAPIGNDSGKELGVTRRGKGTAQGTVKDEDGDSQGPNNPPSKKRRVKLADLMDGLL
jgi:hypothetical protein